MQTIYANYAATSPALSHSVRAEVTQYLCEPRLNSGRNFEGLDEGHIALRARRAIASLFAVPDPLRVIFTSGATAALNMAIHGFVRPGTRVVTTSVEHNASARPLHYLHRKGLIQLEYLQCKSTGELDPQALRSSLTPDTSLFVCTHASNMLGTILPVEDALKIVHEFNFEHGLENESAVRTVVDAAQTAGALPFTLDDSCDALVFAGHKALGALAGTGGMVLSTGAAANMRVWLSGGTGSRSESLDMPEFLPDRFEPGTQNTAGILSLAAAAEEILREGVQKIRDYEVALTASFLQGLKRLKKIKIYGTANARLSMPVVSVTVGNLDSASVSRILFEKHGIITRSGLHCSPLAHKTAGTYPTGTVRFSFGRTTNAGGIDAILSALAEF